MAVIISEEKDQGAAWQVTYRGLVGTGRADLTSLEQHSPLWLLDFLLGNRILAREPVKIVSCSVSRHLVLGGLTSILQTVFLDTTLER